MFRIATHSFARKLTPFICLLLVMAMILPATPARADVTDEQVGALIAKIKKELFATQKADGSFEPSGEVHGRNQGGVTALVTLALLVSGESMQNPKIAKAIKYLRNVEMEGTYAIAVRAHVWSYLPHSYQDYLKKDASWLMTTHQQHKRGLFDYTQGYRSRVDHSVTQYGMLGLWQAKKRGLPVPISFWNAMKLHFTKAQFPSGGWGYNESQETERESMTLAGLTAMLVAQQELERKSKKPNAALNKSIDAGMAWMDKRFQTGSSWYALYGLERVALASGTRYFNKRDWYQTGAEKAVRSRGAAGGGHGGASVNKSFMLMFLSRGRVPVWVNKLEIPGKAWNNHPNDLYFLTQYISNMREGELNWQTVSLDYRPDSWLLAPVAFVSSHEGFEPTDKQMGNLKQYLDRGGLLVCNPDEASRYFKDSIKSLANKLYPQYQFRLLEPTHPLFHVLNQVENPKKYKVWGLSNGARELMIMFENDWGYTWQADSRQQGPIWDIAANLFALATNKGVLNNRLVPPFEARKKRSVKGEIVVGRAKYDGNWLPEPASWKLLGNPMFNKTGINIKTADVELSALGGSSQKIVHLAGTAAYKLTDAERQALKEYVDKGGTVLIETVGGLGDFASDMEKQLSGVFKNPPVPLGSGDAVISGDGITGGHDCSRVSWRWRTVQTLAVGGRPRLAAILVGGRPAVFFSHEDLSLGMLGVRQWHVMGYSPESARKLATNILLSAKK